MDSKNKLIYAAAGFIAFVGIAMLLVEGHLRETAHTGTQTTHEEQEEPSVAAGNKAANFKLESLGGTTVSLDQLRGKVIFLNVWATWCGPCREEMPSMETLYDEFKANRDFVMLAVSQDTKGRLVVAPYVEKNGYHFTILLDPENEVGESYDVSGVPETFIIDRQGRIAAHHMGAFDWSRPDVKDALQQLLDAKSS
ncbi:MAG TPA: TlpA disulfide reductase family protein [Candidatus Binataceae bacterium]|nr:TlpA disulfide reductase family protein [Candidatus Binataceae bacterium]